MDKRTIYAAVLTLCFLGCGKPISTYDNNISVRLHVLERKVKEQQEEIDRLRVRQADNYLGISERLDRQWKAIDTLDKRTLGKNSK